MGIRDRFSGPPRQYTFVGAGSHPEAATAIACGWGSCGFVVGCAFVCDGGVTGLFSTFDVANDLPLLVLVVGVCIKKKITNLKLFLKNHFL